MKQGQRLTAHVSAGALAACCWLAASLIPILTALGAIPGLSYMPRHKTAWLVCMAALLATALWADARNAAKKRHWMLLMPVLTCAVLRLFIPADGMGRWQCGLALVDLILGGALFARAKAGGKLKPAMGALSVLLLVPTLAMMLLTAIIGTPSVTLRRYPDPGGFFEAEVCIADEGATGGSTTVTVCQSWPFGPVRVVRGKTAMEWIDPDELEVEWMDEDTLKINGEAWKWREENRDAS